MSGASTAPLNATWAAFIGSKAALRQRVLLLLPDWGFDPTEAAVTWKTLTERGHVVVPATATGARPSADPHVLAGFLGGGCVWFVCLPSLRFQVAVTSPRETEKGGGGGKQGRTYGSGPQTLQVAVTHGAWDGQGAASGAITPVCALDFLRVA